ncbi:MAG: FliH/SctL family protein [Anaerofustis sp.]
MPNIIKTTNYSENSSSFVPNETDLQESKPSLIVAATDPQETAEAIVQEAKRKAAKEFDHTVKEAELIAAAIKDDAKRQSEEIKKRSKEIGFKEGFDTGKTQGYQDGFNEGYEEGLRRAGNENRSLRESLDEAVNAVNAQKEEQLNAFSDGLEELVLIIAKAVLKRETELHPEYLADVAYESIADYNAHAWIKIMLSEHSYQTLLENVPNFTDHLGGNVKLIAAHGLNNSDCFCETPSQVIDAGVDMQFENIEQALREE